MFKKKKTQNDTPRGRQRISQVAPRSNATVFSYHASRATDTDSRARLAEKPEVRKRHKWWSFEWVQHIGQRQVLGVFIVFILVLLLVGLDTTPKIVVVGDASNDIFLQNTAVYQKATKTLLSANLANKNKLTINTASIAFQLQQKFPELRTVSISLPFTGRQPVVFIQPASPQIVLAMQDNNRFVLDSAGRALALVTSTTKLPTNNPIPVVTDTSGLAVNLNSIALSRSSVAFISEIAGQLNAKKVAVDSWTLGAGANELDVRVSGVPYFVKFNLRGIAKQEAGTFLAVKQNLEGSKITPAQYIDVRVTGRAYYK